MTNEKLKINDMVYFVSGRMLDKKPFINSGFIFDIDEKRDYIAVRVYHDETYAFAISELGKLVFISSEEANKVVDHLPSVGTGMYLIHKDNSITRVVIDHYWKQSIHFTSKESIPITRFDELLYPTKEAAVKALQEKLARR